MRCQVLAGNPVRGELRRASTASPRGAASGPRRIRIRGAPTCAVSAESYYRNQPLPRLNPDGSVTEDVPATGKAPGVAGSQDPAGSLDLTPMAAPGGGSGSTALVAPGDRVQVQFVVPQYVTSYGQVLKVVGALEELGGWEPNKAPIMKWNEGHTWTLDIDLPSVGTVAFKVVMQEQGGATRWEDGGDRTLELPTAVDAPHNGGGAPGTAAPLPVGAVGVACPWGDTGSTTVAAKPDKTAMRAQLAAVEARLAALKQKRRRAEEQRTRARLSAPAQASGAPARLPTATTGTTAGTPPPQIQVPLITPSELPLITGGDGNTSSTPGMAAAEARFNTLLGEIAAGDTELLASAARNRTTPDDSTAVPPTRIVPAVSGEDEAVPVPESLGERVLGATVEQLLTAAQEALSRDEAPAGAVAMGAADCEALRAAAVLGELQAATAALEQAAGFKPPAADPAAPLLAASTRSAATGTPSAPTMRGAAATVTMTLTPKPETAGSSSARSRWQSVVSRVIEQARILDDGSLVFSSDSLSVDVNPEELLLAALERARSRTASEASLASLDSTPAGDAGANGGPAPESGDAWGATGRGGSAVVAAGLVLNADAPTTNKTATEPRDTKTKPQAAVTPRVVATPTPVSTAGAQGPVAVTGTDKMPAAPSNTVSPKMVAPTPAATDAAVPENAVAATVLTPTVKSPAPTPEAAIPATVTTTPPVTAPAPAPQPASAAGTSGAPTADSVAQSKAAARAAVLAAVAASLMQSAAKNRPQPPTTA